MEEGVLLSLWKDDVIIEDVQHIQELWSGYGAIKRIYYRRGSVGRSSVVVKSICPPIGDKELNSQSHRRKERSYEVEQYFYENLAKKLDRSCCLVPALLSCYSKKNQTIFVLEDLHSFGLTRRGTLSIPDTRACVLWLAHFHKTFLGQNNSLHKVWKQGTYWHLDTRKNEYLNIGDEDPLKKHAKQIDKLLKDAKHKTLLHGDAKLANFCFSVDGDSVGAVDFQYCGWGVGVSDLAYCIGHRFSTRGLVEECDLDKNEAQLLDLYFRTLDASEEVENEWRSLYPVAVADYERFLAGWASNGRDSSTSHITNIVNNLVASLECEEKANK